MPALPVQPERSLSRDLSRLPSALLLLTLPWLLPPVLHSSLPNFSADHRLALALRITTPAVRFDPAGLEEKGLQNLVKTVMLRGEDGERLNDQLRYDT